MLKYPTSKLEWLILRHQNINSTEISALFGLSPYQTAFEVGVIKSQKGPDPQTESTERMRWGIRLQHAIARGIAEEYGVKIRAVTGYAEHSYKHCRMGASFDYEIVGLKDEIPPDCDPILRDMYSKKGPGILEIKNVDTWVFKSEWNEVEGGGVEAPAHVELQLQHQLACISRSWGAIGVMIGGNRLEVLARERDDEVHALIRKKCETFWNNLHDGILPPVELPADADMISRIYRYAEPSKVLDAQADESIAAICKEYTDAAADEKAAQDRKATAKASLLLKIKDAEKVLVTGYNVSASVTAECEIPAYTRSAYRNVRISVQKPKAQPKSKSKETVSA